MFFHWTMLLMIPPAILAIYASFKVRSTFSQYARYRASSGLTGAEAARALLDHSGLRDVRIEQVEGELTDHYDPRQKVLRLSQPVHSSGSLSALGVAAHETGHAVQDATGYLPLKLRAGIVPLAAVGNNLGLVLFVAGMMLMGFTRAPWGRVVALVGIGFFAAGFAFTVVTLPVEFNASKRALAMLTSEGIVTAEEQGHTRRVLSAAALTYVAAAFVALMMLLRFILIFASASRRE